MVIEIVDLPVKNVIFHIDVSLPEGMGISWGHTVLKIKACI